MKKFIIEKGRFGKKMILCAPLTENTAEYCAKNKIVELELNWAKGFRGGDLSALRKMAQLISFEICDYTIADISDIHYLDNLKSLKISTYCKTPVDLSRFGRLEELSIFWRKGIVGFDKLKNIKSLFIYKYNPAAKDLRELAEIGSLQRLSLKVPSITSIGNIQSLANLEFLGIYAATKLENIEGLGKLRDLKHLEIEGCAKIRNIEPIAELAGLEKLSVSNCSKIESLKPVEKVKGLCELRFSESTVIVDGDITPVRKLPRLTKIVFQNRRHYNLKTEEFDLHG